jgi:hypothetical protein
MATDTYTGGPAKPTIEKDPDATLDYPFDWTAYLLPITDHITDAEFILETPLVLERQELDPDGKIAVVWISGGTIKETHRVTCRITTAEGRIDDRSIFLKMVAK